MSSKLLQGSTSLTKYFVWDRLPYHNPELDKQLKHPFIFLSVKCVQWNFGWKTEEKNSPQTFASPLSQNDKHIKKVLALYLVQASNVIFNKRTVWVFHMQCGFILLCAFTVHGF